MTSNIEILHVLPPSSRPFPVSSVPSASGIASQQVGEGDEEEDTSDEGEGRVWERLAELRRKETLFSSAVAAPPRIAYCVSLACWQDENCLQHTQESSAIDKEQELLRSCQVADAQGARRWLQIGVDPNCRTSTGVTPLMFACLNSAGTAVNSLRIVEDLLSWGADFSLESRSGGYALLFAMSANNNWVVELLATHGATLSIGLGLRANFTAASTLSSLSFAAYNRGRSNYQVVLESTNILSERLDPGSRFLVIQYLFAPEGPGVWANEAIHAVTKPKIKR